MSFNWATKIVTTTRETAKPSMLRVAPRGSIKRLMRPSMLLFSSTQRIVVGSVAALKSKREKTAKSFTMIKSHFCGKPQRHTIFEQIKDDCYDFNAIKGIRQIHPGGGFPYKMDGVPVVPCWELKQWFSYLLPLLQREHFRYLLGYWAEKQYDRKHWMCCFRIGPSQGWKNVLNPRSQNKIFVPLKGSFLKFPTSTPVAFLWGSPRAFDISLDRVEGMC